jgi:hypothetical protein
VGSSLAYPKTALEAPEPGARVPVQGQAEACARIMEVATPDEALAVGQDGGLRHGNPHGAKRAGVRGLCETQVITSIGWIGYNDTRQHSFPTCHSPTSSPWNGSEQ